MLRRIFPFAETAGVMANIFISCTPSDREWAKWLLNEIEALGHIAHIHELEVDAGDILKWIKRRYDKSHYLLCVISEEYLKMLSFAALEEAAKERLHFVLFVVVRPLERPTITNYVSRCDLFGCPEDEARVRFHEFFLSSLDTASRSSSFAAATIAPALAALSTPRAAPLAAPAASLAARPIEPILPQISESLASGFSLDEMLRLCTYARADGQSEDRPDVMALMRKKTVVTEPQFYPAPAPANAPPLETSLPQSRPRQSSLLWLAASITFVGGLAFLYRHEIMAAFAALFAKVSATHSATRQLAVLAPSPSGRIVDLVDVSAFAPNGAVPGDSVLVQVFLHLPTQARAAMARAREADPSVPRRGCTTLKAEVARGQSLDVFLESDGANIDEPFQSLTWRGQPCVCQFRVRLPKTSKTGACCLRVQVLIDRVPVGSLRFDLSLHARKPPALRGDTAVRYRRAFLSYASADRAEVLKRAQSLRAVGITFFQDALALEPGERWEKRLYGEIDECDLFLLFWSTSAAASTWVRREVDYAVACQRRSSSEAPDIAPIILEGPPVPLPIPDQLSHLHFNDYLLYAIAGSARGADKA